MSELLRSEVAQLTNHSAHAAKHQVFVRALEFKRAREFKPALSCRGALQEMVWSQRARPTCPVIALLRAMVTVRLVFVQSGIG